MLSGLKTKLKQWLASAETSQTKVGKVPVDALNTRVLTYSCNVSDLLEVIEVTTPPTPAATLFRKSFNAEIPQFPHHMLVRYIGGNSSEPPIVGYVHFTATKDFYLCGGMCIDATAYKRMDATHRTRIGEAGGITEIMLRACFYDLTDKPAIFGYCGDVRAMKVDLRAGFVPTQHQYLIVHWKHEISDSRKAEFVEDAYAIGAF
jgi:hypothetical protein